MTHTLDTSATMRLSPRFLDELVKDKVWRYVGGFLLNYTTDLDTQIFVSKIKEEEAFLKQMATVRGESEFVFRLKDDRVLKFIGRDNVGFFFDITEQVKAQSQIKTFIDAARDSLTLTEAIGIVERNIRFE
jgi:hypothetical protein